MNVWTNMYITWCINITNTEMIIPAVKGYCRIDMGTSCGDLGSTEGVATSWPECPQGGCQIYSITVISWYWSNDPYLYLIYLYMHDKISITAILVLMLSKIINYCLVFWSNMSTQDFIAQDKGAWGEIID